MTLKKSKARDAITQSICKPASIVCIETIENQILRNDDTTRHNSKDGVKNTVTFHNAKVGVRGNGRTSSHAPLQP